MQIVLALAALLVLVQDKDDPRYKYWSSCKVGSWVKTRMSMDQGGVQFEMDQVQKLIDIADDKVTLEISGTRKFNGKELPMPPRKQDIRAKYKEGDVLIEKEGDEEIEVAGKKFKCHWLELTTRNGPNPGKMKAWMTEEVPGGVIKAEITPPNNPVPLVMTAVEWEKK